MREIVAASGLVLSSSPPRLGSPPGIKNLKKKKKKIKRTTTTSFRDDKKKKLEEQFLPLHPQQEQEQEQGHHPKLSEEESGFVFEDAITILVAEVEQDLPPLKTRAAPHQEAICDRRQELQSSPHQPQPQHQVHQHERRRAHHHHQKQKNNGKTFSAWRDLLTHWRQCVRAKRQRLAEELGMEEAVVQLFCNPEHDHGVTPTSASQLLDYLFVGGSEAAADAEWLRANDITHVLNVAEEIAQISEVMYHELDIERRWIRMLDHSGYPVYQHFEEAIDFVAKAKESGGRVLVHCAAGISRSATIALASLMCLESMSLRDALLLARERRPAIYPNKGFYEALFAFEEELFFSNSIPRISLTLHEECLA